MNSEDKIKFEEWKQRLKNEIFNEADQYNNDPDFNKLLHWEEQIKDKLARVERNMKETPAGPRFEERKKRYNYYDGLADALIMEMFDASPVETLAWLQETFFKKDQSLYSREDLGYYIVNYNRKKLFEQERESILVEKTPLMIEDPKSPEIERKIELLDKQYDFCKQYAEDADKRIPDDIKHFISVIDAGIDMDKLAKQHSEYMANLAEKAREIQDEQIKLLAAKENGDETVTTKMLTSGTEKFESIYRERNRLRYIAEVMLPSLGERIDLEQQEEDDITLKASGSEVFGKMTPKQRYEARVSLKKMQTNKERLGPFTYLALHLPNEKMDKTIKKYISTDRMDVKRLMGYTREDLAVREEARRLAEKQREEKAAEEHDEESSAKPDAEKGEDSAKSEKADAKKDTAKKEEPVVSEEDSDLSEILELYGQLSPEARVEFCVKHFDLNEDEKEIMMMVEQLSPEAKARLNKTQEKTEKNKEPVKE